ncbi:MAG: TM2 domain-containing protein [Bacteroidales bacterium]|jgi:TM2 domain-containing membrane protein YozV|nr:TM2 domain-containing protein [Bacteroidales bacterium]
MKNFIYIFLAVLLLTGKIWAQNQPIDEFFSENRDNLSTEQISTLTPLNLKMENGEWRMENFYDTLDNHLAQPNSQLSILNSQLNKDPVIAWLINFPTGIFGLHRAYLGTSGKTIFLYFVTVGGVFGIVPMIDWILLLKGIQTGDISKYIGNRKFIMWL